MHLRSTIAFAAMLCSTALSAPTIAAEPVQVYDEQVPSIEALRAILIPEVPEGTATRRIILPSKSDDPAVNAAPTASVAAMVATAAPAASAAPGAAPSPAPVAVATARPSTSPAAAPAPTAVAFHVKFGLNSAAVPQASDAQLDRVVELLRQEPTLTLRIEGHTDASGDADYNLKLSRRRAASVKSYMVEHGVDDVRLVAVGKGKTELLSNDPFDASNRRVQFVNAKGQI